MGHLDEAIAAHRGSIRLKPDYAEAHRDLGVALLKKGLIDDALVECREAIRLHPDDALAHSNLGNSLRKQGQAAEAISEFRRAIDLQPSLTDARLRLGRLLLEEGWLDDAIATLRDEIRGSASARAASLLGTALLQKGLFAEAWEHLRALDAADGAALAGFQKGLCLQALGRFGEAVEEMRLSHETGSKQAGSNVPSADWLADARELAAQEPEVVRRLEDGTDPATREGLRLAPIAMAKGRPVAAARWYQAALIADPLAVDPMTRLAAARAAVQASQSGSEGASKLDDAARARWRSQALDWLQAQVAEMRDPDTDAQQRVELRRTLRVASCHVDLSAVRSQGIESLPGGERAAWRSFWQAVGDVTAEPPR